MMKLIITGELGTIPKSLEREVDDLEIKGRIETIQTAALLRLAIILSRGDLKRLVVPHTQVKYSQLMLV